MNITKEEVIVGNKLIAKLLGFQYYPHPEQNPGYWSPAGRKLMGHPKLHKDSWLCRSHNDLPFRHSWHYIMTAYIKIAKDELFGEDQEGIILFNIMYERLADGDGIIKVWEAMVEFLKWYYNKSSLLA